MADYSSKLPIGAVALVFLMFLLLSQLGKADENAPYFVAGGNRNPSSNSDSKSSSSKGDDAAQMVAKAMQCFNNRTIYRSCDEDFRLNESGNLVVGVSLEQMDAYCGGPCFVETNLVLNCVEGIMRNFRFYNNATINDIKDTFKASCSGTGTGTTAGTTASTSTTTADATGGGNSESAAKHLQASQTSAVKSGSWGMYVTIYVMISQAFRRW